MLLVVFETGKATVYQVRTRHRNDEVRKVVPSDYTGDEGEVPGPQHDAQALPGVKQQKCLAHLLRSIGDMIPATMGRGRSFGNRLSGLLREAMALWEAYHRGEAANVGAQARRLKRELRYHLRGCPMADADNWRLQSELGWHDDRGCLPRFLDDLSIRPTDTD